MKTRKYSVELLIIPQVLYTEKRITQAKLQALASTYVK